MRRHGSDEQALRAVRTLAHWHGKSTALLKHSPKSRKRKAETVKTNQLRLVTDDPAPGFTSSTDPTRQVFEHWLFMTGRNPRRCKLGPTRRAAINAALQLYDLETVQRAIDGMADDALEGKPASMRDAMREIEWFLATEARVDHWAAKGDALHERAVQAEQVARQRAHQPEPVAADPAVAAAARERLRKMAAQGRGEVA